MSTEKCFCHVRDKKTGECYKVKDSDARKALEDKADKTELANKVDKVDGKQLSTNDFTDVYKNQIESNTSTSHNHSNKSLLDSYTQTEANLKDAVSKKHSHSNKTILDNTTASYTTDEQTKLNNKLDKTANAVSATKATQDSDGNVIKDTYLKRSGGTLTGQLINNNSIKYNWDQDQYTAPTSSTRYKVTEWFYDTNNKNVGVRHLAHHTNGNIEHQIDVRRDVGNTGTNTHYAQLLVGMKPDGTAYAKCPTPQADSDTNDIATTAWVRDRLKPIYVGNEDKNTMSVGWYKFLTVTKKNNYADIMFVLNIVNTYGSPNCGNGIANVHCRWNTEDEIQSGQIYWSYRKGFNENIIVGVKNGKSIDFYIYIQDGNYMVYAITPLVITPRGSYNFVSYEFYNNPKIEPISTNPEAFITSEDNSIVKQATQDASGNVITDTYVKKSGDTISGTLLLTNTTDASNDYTKEPAIIIGNKTGNKLHIDNNELQALAGEATADNPKPVAWLGLNKNGGDIGFATNANGMYLKPNSKLEPSTHNNLDLGSSAKKWKDGYFAGTVTATTFNGTVTSASNATKINNLELKQDENGVLKIGDTIIPQKKLVMDTPISIKLDAGRTKIYSSTTSLVGKTLEVVFQSYAGSSNDYGVCFKFKVGYSSGSNVQTLLRSSSSMSIAVATFGVYDGDTDLYIDVNYSSGMSTTVSYKIVKIYEIIE